MEFEQTWNEEEKAAGNGTKARKKPSIAQIHVRRKPWHLMQNHGKSACNEIMGLFFVQQAAHFQQ